MLNGTELNLLFSQVFGYLSTESGHRIGFLVDVPSAPRDDTPDWNERRKLVMQWARALVKTSFHACMVYAYESVGRANAELIHPMYCIALADDVPDCAEQLAHCRGEMANAEEIYSRAEYWIALTQYSATAPLKMAAARFGFRAVTMPGFTLSMLPALSVDIAALDVRVTKLAWALTLAHTAELTFDVGGQKYDVTFDLRFRMGFAASGRYLNNGQVGNLPSGEAYIVPYEGEKIGRISMTEGILPIEHDGKIVLCEISENRVVCIDGENEFAESLRKAISQDPARANVAELGLGVLGEWGVEAVGHPLLDEKLAIHVALGRSEHLGGVTSSADFHAPEFVSHTDYIYHHSLMPDIHVAKGILYFDDHESIFVVQDKYMYDNL